MYNYYELEENNPRNEFVETEIKNLLELIKLEKYQIVVDMYSERNQMDAEEREKEGKTINNLKCDIHKKYYLKFSRKEKIKTEIKKGAYCLLSVNDKEINCWVREITSHSISVSLEEKIRKFSKNKTAKIDLILNDVTFNRWENNLLNLTKNGEKALKFKSKKIAITADNEDKKINFINKSLDPYQKKAVKRAVNCNDFFLIHGPFGTGKTTTIIELILQETNLNHKLLVCSESNTAIDNILKKLRHTNINFTRVGTSNKIPNYLQQYTLDYKINNQITGKSINNEERQQIEEEILKNSQVILTTNSSAGSIILSDIQFHIAIIDEASQATIPSTLIPINKAEKFILIGDHKQLPPVVSSNNTKYLSKSLFEELIENYPQQSQELLIQYRMNEILMTFPNKKFYGNKLKCSKLSKDNYMTTVLEKYDSSSPLIFIDTSKYENNKEFSLDSHSYKNNLESEIVLEIINMYLDKKINPQDIGVISPYSKQVRLIKEKAKNISVKSVDGFQGGEKDIIIISLVRSNEEKNIGFLDDMRRLNVSLTRAKKKLIVIGNKETLQSNKDYKEFIEFCELI